MVKQARYTRTREGLQPNCGVAVECILIDETDGVSMLVQQAVDLVFGKFPSKWYPIVAFREQPVLKPD
jgi:hypothetical protein